MAPHDTFTIRYRRLATRYSAVVTLRSFVPGSELLRASPASLAPAPRIWRPPADVSEDERFVTITVDLAGIGEDDVDIQLFDDTLLVEGSRPAPGPGRGLYLAAEIRSGPFRLEVPIPAQIDVEGVEAQYERGILTITLPKAPRSWDRRREQAPMPGPAELE